MAIFSWLSDQSDGKSKLPCPPGRSRSIPLLGQTLSFHDSAHDEIKSIVESTGSSSIRLNVIARNVALVTSYEDANKVLDQRWKEESPVSREQAYKQLMADFYSSPNLLLEDEDHDNAKEHRQLWDTSIQHALQGSNVQVRVTKIVEAWLHRTCNGSSEIEDLYDACKDLGHNLALGTFLSLNSGNTTSNVDDASHEMIREWSEEMLRGQFTLPLGINVGFFQNTFSRGQAAKVSFDGVVEQQLTGNQRTSKCPFAVNPSGQLSDSSLLSHHSMFSSSLVVKGFASLATALLLQLFRENDGNSSIADKLRSSEGESYTLLLDSIITETERLCPPIIGVMRRVTVADGVDLTCSQTNVPCGWDIWPYFPLANRDERVFGSDACSFKADRYLGQKETPLPLTFGGAGVKNCAGQDIVRLWLREMAASIVGKGSTPACTLQFNMQELDSGVQSLLGWLPLNQSVSWKGVKQLPTQRPRKAIKVHIAPRPAAQS